MSTLIPTYAWTDFLKVVKQGKVKELKSGIVTFNGEYLFPYINGHHPGNSTHIRIQTEYLGVRSNILGGKTIEEILEAVSV